MLIQRILFARGLGLVVLLATCRGESGGPIATTGTISGTITLSNVFLAPPATKLTPPNVTAIPVPGTPVMRKSALAGPAGASAAPLPRPLAAAARGPEYTADELIVTYRAAPLGAPPMGSLALAAPAAARRAARTIATRLAVPAAAGRLDVRGISPVILAARVRATDPGSLDALAAELRRDPAVATVERNAIVRVLDRLRRPAAVPATSANDPLYPFQAWHYAAIDLPEAWDITRGSASVLVAVVDDGINNHPAIAANLTTDGYDFASNTPLNLCGGGTIGSAGDGDGPDANPTQPADYFYVDPATGCVDSLNPLGNHGLHVAGTIGAVGNDGVGVTGVNWTVRIRPVRVVGVSGAGSTYDVAQGVLYAAGLAADDGAGGTVRPATGARVINVSLGSPTPTTVLRDAIVAATGNGALVVAAAGNAATSDPNYPAAHAEVLSVSAVGPDLDLASYSSFGSTVDVAAPGGDFADGDGTFGVASTTWNFVNGTPNYALYNGTSMAAPHVTGVAALLLAQAPSLTPAQLRAKLETHVVDLGAPGRDDLYGAGLINARAALTDGASPARQLFARIYNGTTGAIVQTVAAQGSGAYSITGLADGSYLVFAGQDENGDGLLGLPGRRWGAFGGSATPTSVVVAGASTSTATFSAGFPSETEDNNSPGVADYLAIGGYLHGAISSGTDVDYSVVRIPTAGLYTFETSPVDGACGFALEEDTILRLYDNAGVTELAANDDINATVGNYCSRITANLTPGPYFLRVEGYVDALGSRYRVRARAGS